MSKRRRSQADTSASCPSPFESEAQDYFFDSKSDSSVPSAIVVKLIPPRLFYSIAVFWNVSPFTLSASDLKMLTAAWNLVGVFCYWTDSVLFLELPLTLFGVWLCVCSSMLHSLNGDSVYAASSYLDKQCVMAAG